MATGWLASSQPQRRSHIASSFQCWTVQSTYSQFAKGLYQVSHAGLHSIQRMLERLLEGPEYHHFGWSTI